VVYLLEQHLGILQNDIIAKPFMYLMRLQVKIKKEKERRMF